MPVNYFTPYDHPTPLMFTKHSHTMGPPSDTAADFFGGENSEEQQNDNQVMMGIPKEPLFEKPLTPSDVGKLNRLVIPKQHAERYFPLTGKDSGGGAEKGGFLLGFEDECGKHWRFRYSYWTSSQSYVLTKGWSRFVKDKRLDAGDVVLFERHRIDGDRFFIGWRRRNSVASGVLGGVKDGGGGRVAQPSGTAVGGGWAHAWHPYPPPPTYNALPYQPNCLHAGASGNSRRSVRLFGVNLEYEANESEPTTPDCSTTTSSTSQQSQSLGNPYPYYTNSNDSSSYNPYNHMDINFSRDVNQMRYHQG
ncbi:unnamed protein product [Cuscuta epithymum]|uniref:TF-B3 domain-containing protein n=1 Tax=Cuscuta epithymum TaxID=186058 RepID=A0AAV0EWZ2_9ASTE|nr:unnamed protein product [Cuscuta epithymum]